MGKLQVSAARLFEEPVRSLSTEGPHRVLLRARQMYRNDVGAAELLPLGVTERYPGLHLEQSARYRTGHVGDEDSLRSQVDRGGS